MLATQAYLLAAAWHLRPARDDFPQAGKRKVPVSRDHGAEGFVADSSLTSAN